jgi:hypothetical protein
MELLDYHEMCGAEVAELPQMSHMLLLVVE